MNRGSSVIIVGNGDLNERALRDVASHYPVIALDGAYQTLSDKGFDVTEVIGDLDSLSDAAQEHARRQGVTVTSIAEQDSNDFEKALYSIEASSYICFGLTGGRFDHLMANLHVMAKYSVNKNIIMITNDDILTMHKGISHIASLPQALVAVLPLAPIIFAHSTGLGYPLTGVRLAMGEMVSSSNYATDSLVTLTPRDEDCNQLYVVSRAIEMWQEGQFLTG